MEILMRHDFPGNVRELENAIEYCFVLCHNGLIDESHLPEELKSAADSTARELSADAVPPLAQSEADTIRIALSRNHGHQGRTAKQLGISRTTLWRKMSKHGLRAEDFQRL
jgi:DNA-binding NtrC family response regulator